MEALLGLTQSQAVDLFGPPGATQTEFPAEIWSYTDRKCELRLFFYMDLETEVYRTLRYEIDPPDTVAVPRPECVKRLIKGHDITSVGEGRHEQPS